MKKISMKTLPFIAFLFFGVNSLSSQSLTARITYNVFSENIKSSQSQSHFLNFGQIEHLETVSAKKPINFILTIQDHEARFEPEFDLPTKKNLGYTFDRVATLAEHDKIYYHDRRTGQSLFQSFWTKNYVVSVDKPEWTYTGETKKIGGFTCKKAVLKTQIDRIRGMEYVAPVEVWYAPEIQTDVGIQYLHGLPGLTLEATFYFYEGSITFIARGMDLNPEGNISIHKPSADHMISQAEYHELIEKMNTYRN